ncbi:4-(cytidine 5'-diphospho)-2-C-methyl-D-erythritol kinase [Novosphingobium aquiterrae]|uniref:4-diphosphocytidyl-2-C-methyl-D-erythritol kinase n=1 Tax=Novosphingobium aquiterrae TaxID=624388 RepID=A0ABV6PE35_9SPHN
MIETAYAKINLALHIRGRRADGYHELETLFAFVDAGDVLSVAPASRDTLRTLGEFGGQLADLFDNIVMQALTALPRPQGWAVTLDKGLPVAAGLGGGSADAGAVFRLVEREYDLPDDWPARAARLGADVPACVASQTCIGRGIGTDLEPGPQDLTDTPVLLVNPRLPLSTGPVFKGWDGIDRGGLTEGTAREIALVGRNDLEASAIALCPEIGAVLASLRNSNAWLVRMSGSGATCFALFEKVAARDAAARAIAVAQPGWWQMSGQLR